MTFVSMQLLLFRTENENKHIAVRSLRHQIHRHNQIMCNKGENI